MLKDLEKPPDQIFVHGTNISMNLCSRSEFYVSVHGTYCVWFSDSLIQKVRRIFFIDSLQIFL